MQGKCLCGSVAYTVSAPLGPVTACHCRMCRKSSGHYAAAVPAVAITGDVRWFASSAGARRGFCPTCGSSLFWEEFDGLLYLMAGALEGATGLSMDGHIFYADKGDYYRAGPDEVCWAAERSGERVDP
jgi:hypothetical protein